MKKQGHSVFGLKYWLYDFAKITAAIPTLIAFRPKFVYENESARKKIRGGAILIANHNGFLDPVYVMTAIWYRRHRFVCIKEIFEGKRGFFFRNFLCIPIDRENFGLDKLNEITGHLEDGYIVSMFPEGRINQAQEQGMASFKSGMILMSLRSGKPVVPVYIHKREHWYERLVLVIGEPVDVRKQYGERPTLAQIESASAALRDKEYELSKLGQGGKHEDRKQ